MTARLPLLLACLLPAAARAVPVEVPVFVDGRPASCRLSAGAPGRTLEAEGPTIDLPRGRWEIVARCALPPRDPERTYVAVVRVDVKGAALRRPVHLRRARLQAWLEEEGRRLDGRIEVRRAGRTGDPPLLVLSPSRLTPLAAGRYDLSAVAAGADGAPVVTHRGVRLSPGRTSEVRFDLSPGQVRVAVTEGGRRATASVFVHRPGRTSHLERVPAGRPATLPPGRYDLRVVLEDAADRPVRWVRDVDVRPGRAERRAVRFPVGRLRAEIVREARRAEGTLQLLQPGAAAPFALVDSGDAVTLSPGRYRVHAVLEDGSERDGGEVSIRAGRTTSLRVDLTPARVRLSATLNGRALGGATATLLDAHGTPVVEDLALPGEVALRGGTYRARVRLPVQPPRTVERPLEVAWSETRRVVLALELGELAPKAPWAGPLAHLAAFRAGTRAATAEAALGAPLWLEPGVYDVAVAGRDGRRGWALGVLVTAGGRAEPEVAPPK